MTDGYQEIKKLENVLKRKENELALLEIFNDWIWNYYKEQPVCLFEMDELNDHVDGNVRYFWDMVQAANHFDIDDRYCIRRSASLESSNSVTDLIEDYSGMYGVAKWLITENLVDNYDIDFAENSEE